MNAYGFMPHGFCFQWRPGVLWLHVASDLSIAVAYFGISILLIYFLPRRADPPIQMLSILFGAFITLCGITHLLGIWVLWHPNYYMEGYVKAATAAVSLTTLAVMPRALKAAVKLETLVRTRGRELERALADLRAQTAVRESVEASLRQSQKMEAIGQLTGGIAHDFNNMLQLVGGSLEMAQLRAAKGNAAAASRHMDNALQTVARAAALTNRLLAFGRRHPLQTRAIQVDELLQALADMLRRTLSSASAAIELDLRLNVPLSTVVCDPNQLDSALLNLTINARDAMPDGGRLVISTRQASLSAAELVGQDAQPGDYVEIIVADNGTGMDESTRLRVFEPFFTTKPIGKGTGLGLSQVYGFTHQSGGLITIESQEGAGTEVHIFLPRVPSEKNDEAAPETADGVGIGSARVLLVEDETVGRETVAEFLRSCGYDVLEAEDGPAALDLFRQNRKPDLLITDIGLPNGLNGRQVAEIVRETCPAMPVLFITGYAGSVSVDDLEPGMEMLFKPFALAKLTAKVEALLAKKALPTLA